MTASPRGTTGRRAPARPPAPTPPPAVACPACRAAFPADDGLVHCPRCGWDLGESSGGRMHRFACLTAGCAGRQSYSALWLPELARGYVWTCWVCGVRQVARVPLEDSAYLGFTEEDPPPEHADTT